MSDTHSAETNGTKPAEDSAKRKAVADHTFLKADGTEAESPMDNAASVKFSLEGDDKSWVVDFSKQRLAMETAGESEQAVNEVLSLALFGAKTWLTNRASRERNNKKVVGDGMTPQQKHAMTIASQVAALDEMLEDWHAGNWSAEGEGVAVAGIADLAAAIVAVQTAAGKTVDLADITEKVKAKDKAGRAALRKNANVDAALAKIRADRKAKAAASAPAVALDI